MAMIVNVGMWLERYVIIVVSLSRDFLPSSWGLYNGTMFDWSTVHRARSVSSSRCSSSSSGSCR